MLNIAGPKCHVGGISGYGTSDYQLMGIGINPAQNDIKEGRPFGGKSGRLLNALLTATGDFCTRPHWYLTNLICTWNNKPTDKQILACAPRLYEEVLQVAPKIIFLFGGIVTEEIIGRKLGACRGAVIPVDETKLTVDIANCYVIPTYHPSGILQAGEHGASLARDVLRDFAKIPDVMKYTTDTGKVTYTVCNTVEEAQHVLDNLNPFLISTLDIETDARSSDKLDVYRDKLYCISITNGGITHTFPRHVLTHGLVWPTNQQWSYQFGMFDVNGIRAHFGIVLPIVHDSGYLHYTCDERSGKDDGVAVHGLETLAREYEGAGFYKEHIKSVWKSLDYDTLVGEGLLDINAKDSAYTERIINRFIPISKSDGVYPVYERILIPAANAFADIHYSGVPVDTQKMSALEIDWGVKYLQQLVGLEQAALQHGFVHTSKKAVTLLDRYGAVEPFNPNSPQQLAQVLFDRLKLPDLSHERSTAAEWLDELSEQDTSGFVDALQINRTFGKMLSTYLLGTKDDVKLDMRIHPEPVLHATVTGRLAYKDPPIQTIPQPYAYENRSDALANAARELGAIRSIFCAEDDEHILLEVDYSQLEIWIAMYLSHDTNMQADLESGDFHGRVTQDVLHVEKEIVSDVFWSNRRTQAKRVTFGIFYGEGPQGLASKKRGLDCTIPQAQQVIDDYFTRYSQYHEWSQEQIHLIRTVGEIQTVFGRKRRIPYIASTHAFRQAVNTPIQSPASDCCLLSLIELHKLLHNTSNRILWTVHDSILFSILKSELHDRANQIADVMCAQKHPLLGPLKVEMKVGSNLYDVKKYDYAAAAI